MHGNSTSVDVPLYSERFEVPCVRVSHGDGGESRGTPLEHWLLIRGWTTHDKLPSNFKLVT